MVDLLRRSALHHRFPITNQEKNLRLEERKFLSKLILRGAHDVVNAGADKALGIGLPKFSPHTARGDAVDVLWMSPDEWLIVGETDTELSMATALEDALAGKHHQVTDVTDYYTVLSLQGAAARAVLMKLTMLDVHQRAFKAGEVRDTMLMHTQATLFQRLDDAVEGGPVFDIFVRWSMADYLWCLIAECGVEFGLPAQKPITGERLVI